MPPRAPSAPGQWRSAGVGMPRLSPLARHSRAGGNGSGVRGQASGDLGARRGRRARAGGCGGWDARRDAARRPPCACQEKVRFHCRTPRFFPRSCVCSILNAVVRRKRRRPRPLSFSLNTRPSPHSPRRTPRRRPTPLRASRRAARDRDRPDRLARRHGRAAAPSVRRHGGHGLLLPPFRSAPSAGHRDVPVLGRFPARLPGPPLLAQGDVVDARLRSCICISCRRPCRHLTLDTSLQHALDNITISRTGR